MFLPVRRKQKVAPNDRRVARACSQRTRSDGQKPKVNWPGASETGIWATVNLDLICAFDGLKGTIEKKLERIEE